MLVTPLPCFPCLENSAASGGRAGVAAAQLVPVGRGERRVLSGLGSPDAAEESRRGPT